MKSEIGNRMHLTNQKSVLEEGLGQAVNGH